MFQRVSTTVNDLNVHQTWDTLPGPISLAYTVNQLGTKLQPEEPQDLQSEVSLQ